MPRDLPDYGALSAQDTVYEVTDLGELAARLGSIVTFDRRGDVIWLDDFKEGLAAWTPSTSGEDAAVELSTARRRSGLFSCLLTAGKDRDCEAEISHAHPFPVLGNFGFEIAFSLGVIIETLDFRIELDDGSNRVRYEIRWDAAAGTLSYYDSSGDYQVIRSGVNLISQASLFHVLKLVVDGVNHEYLRVLLNDTTDLLTNVVARTMASIAANTITISVLNTGRGGVVNYAYVIDTILTQNEPA